MRNLFVAITVMAIAIATSMGAATTRGAEIKIRDNPRNAYDFIRKRLESRFIEYGHDAGRHILLDDCANVGIEIGYDWGDDSKFYMTAELAYDMALIQASLSNRFPIFLWKPQFDNYESVALERIKKGTYRESQTHTFRRNIAAALNAWSVSVRSGHLSVSPDAEGCGAGEVVVVIRPTPRAGRIQYIPRLAYDYCKSVGVNPNNIQLCEYWTDYSQAAVYHNTPSGGVILSGRYKIMVEWHDGVVDVRDLDIDDIPENEAGVVVFNIDKR